MSDVRPTDLVVRLRARFIETGEDGLREAADEIERLRAEVAELTHQRDSVHAQLVHVENAR